MVGFRRLRCGRLVDPRVHHHRQPSYAAHARRPPRRNLPSAL